MTIEAASKKLFSTFKQLLGKSTAYVYAPVSEWVLPAGVTFDPVRDAFLDANGNIAKVDPDVSGKPMTVDVLPGSVVDTFELGDLGVLHNDVSKIWALYDECLEKRLEEAWGIKVDGCQYRITRVKKVPITHPVLLGVEFQERGDG